MRHHCVKSIITALAIMLPLAACEDDELTGPEDGTATLSIFLTDAAGDVENVWVELLGITAQGGAGGPTDLLDEPTEMILLTDLVGAVQLLQVHTGLNPTTFSQLRLVIGDAVLQAKPEPGSAEGAVGLVYVKGDPDLELLGFPDGADGELHCPSCSQSGIKVKVPNDEMEVEGDEEGEGPVSVAMVLDFDVTQSFGHKAGNSGKWVMHPVIHGTLVGDADGDGDILDDLGLPNSIVGAVLAEGVEFPTCTVAGLRNVTDFVPTATSDILDGDGLPMVWTGTVNPDGTYSINLLPPGTYTMGFMNPIVLGNENLSFVATVNQGLVTMEADRVTGVDYTITETTCG